MQITKLTQNQRYNYQVADVPIHKYTQVIIPHRTLYEPFKNLWDIVVWRDLRLAYSQTTRFKNGKNMKGHLIRRVLDVFMNHDTIQKAFEDLKNKPKVAEGIFEDYLKEWLGERKKSGWGEGEDNQNVYEFKNLKDFILRDTMGQCDMHQFFINIMAGISLGDIIRLGGNIGKEDNMLYETACRRLAAVVVYCKSKPYEWRAK